MSMIHGELRGKRPKFFVDQRVHPQTLAVVQTRASGLGVEIVTGDFNTFEFTSEVSGCLVQYPVRRPPPPRHMSLPATLPYLTHHDFPPRAEFELLPVLL